MSDVSQPSAGSRGPFPLIRHLSAWTTPFLVPLPLTPNHITSLSFLLGLASGWCVYVGGGWQIVMAGVLMTLCYVFDNCDGEIARIKQQSSGFGEKYDTFVDWMVHAAFFAALGVAVERETGDAIWFWLGIAAAAGGTVNYLISLIHERGDAFRDESRESMSQDRATYEYPENWKQQLVFIFRELFRADFCFVVLILALFDVMWLLLPAAALGAQVYWLVRFTKSARNFHV